MNNSISDLTARLNRDGIVYFEPGPEPRQGTRNKFYHYKDTCACHFCGQDSSAVLSFHHFDRFGIIDIVNRKYIDIKTGRTVDLSRLVSDERPWPVILRELKKCVCLCSNCHKILHKLERAGAIPYGIKTRAAWEHYTL